MRSKKKRTKNDRSRGGIAIKIKPFARPPALPENFYQSTVDILWMSLDCILHRRPLSFPNESNKGGLSVAASKQLPHSPKTSAADPSSLFPPPPTTQPPIATKPAMATISKEELFGKVQDLCHHSFGPALYRELVKVLEDGAKVCVARLISQHTSAEKTIAYPTPHCCEDERGGVYFPSSSCNVSVGCSSVGDDAANAVAAVASGSGGVLPDMVLLENVWIIWNDYVQYLNCVRSVFLSLDRMFIYIPPPITGNPSDSLSMGRVIPRGAGVGVASNSRGQGDGPFKKGGGGGGGVVGAFNLWDVGMYCLWKHLARYDDWQQRRNNAKATDPSFSNNAKSMDLGDEYAQDKYSLLEALRSQTITCLLVELDLSTRISNKDHHFSSPPGRIGGTRSTMLQHKALLRNCVSIFRTLGHSVPTDTTSKDGTQLLSTNVTEDFLQHLVNSATYYFINESKKWMQDEESTGSCPTKTSYDARALLHHLNARLEEVQEMTAYYLLSSSFGNSGRNTTNNNSRSEIGHHASSTTTRTDRSPNYYHHPQNRILTALVETHLLTPHFSPNHILHPTNLYPILHNEQQEEVAGITSKPKSSDIKLLFQLSRRVRMKDQHNTHQIQQDGITTNNSYGTEQLRMAFDAYGHERGASIVRMRSNHHRSPSQHQTMSNKEMQAKVIPNLLRFKAHLESLHREDFGSDESFGKTVKNILEYVLNDGTGFGEDSAFGKKGTAAKRRWKGPKSRLVDNGNDGADGGKRIAELLAKHVDSHFRNAKSSLITASFASSNPSSGKITSKDLESDGEVYQNAIMDLFRHIYAKDVFEAFYRRDLAKRLLLQKSTSIDSERLFISKLKAECGGSYTSKMEGMFKDMNLSRDVINNYAAYMTGVEQGVGGGGLDVLERRVDTDVTVLTTGYWPVYPLYSNLNLPPSLQAQKNQFETYYKSKYQGRRIAWQNSLGNCIVRAFFPKIQGVRELVVNLCQALVLNCFNEDESSPGVEGYTILDVMKKTGLDDRDEAERVLQSLSVGRLGTRVLRKIDHDESLGNGPQHTKESKKSKKIRRTVSDKDIFVFNSDFTSNQHRVKINNIQMKETASDRTKTHEAVIRDRGCLIDAVTVRIMKARKTLKHSSLVGEVMNQLRFPATAADIKKRLEGLLEREYIERSPEDRSTYNYLA